MKKTIFCIFVKTPKFSPVKTRLKLEQSLSGKIFKLSALATGLEVDRMTSENTNIFATWHIKEKNKQALSYWPIFNDSQWHHTIQQEGDLGDKLSYAYNLLQKDYDNVFFLGGDAPSIESFNIIEAINTLDKNDFYIAPAIDGGFYLFGGKSPIDQELWKSVTYSSDQTANELIALLEKKSTVFIDQKIKPDLDRPEDIEMNIKELSLLKNPNIYQQELRELLLKTKKELL